MFEHEILCTPYEAFKLRPKITTTLELVYAKKVIEIYGCKPIDNENDWNLTCMIISLKKSNSRKVPLANVR